MGDEKQWKEYCATTIVPGLEVNKEIDVPYYHSLFLEAAHTAVARTPLMAYHSVKYWCHGMSYGAEVTSLPTCKGWVYKHYQGGTYIVPCIITDEEEKRQRAVEFKKRVRPWVQDFDGMWAERKKELRNNFEELKSFDMDNALNSQIVMWIYRSLMAYARMWEIHMEVLQNCFSAYLLLSELTKTRFGMPATSPEFQKLLRGFDNKPFQVIKQLHELGETARKEGLESVFVEYEPNEIIPKLKETETGSKWLGRFMEFLEVEGWWPVELMEFNVPYWLEDPSIPLAIIKENIVKKAEFTMVQLREKYAKEREEAIAKFLTMVPREEKEYFTEMLKLAGKASMISEEHAYYCEYNYHSVLRYQYLRLARRLVKAGTMDNPDDIFMLNPEEIESLVMVPEFNDARHLIKARRALYEEWLKSPREGIFTERPGGIEEAFGKDMVPSMDPIIISSAVGELPEPKTELKADIYGVCGSAGDVEGVIRVISSQEEMNTVQKGEILVTVSTDSNWTPVFPIIKGIITDRGGLLSHAAIIGREFGVPAVVNTFVATQKLKTGQRIRLWADEGAIFILE
ncbi:MAG: Chondramide synthase cmdD [Syntrophorhabdus sp. PtaU1.Bin050]|nr:MAG: Chondramide synthase cmdD [Syntrophorhabdus sp. PtaU1.Bin050]